jgi:hypothetical protein
MAGELCNTLHVDISLGKGVAGRGLLSQVLSGICECGLGRWGRGRCCRGRCCRGRLTDLLLHCRVVDGMQVPVDDPGTCRRF